MIFGESGRL